MRDDSERVLELVGDIYDASLDPGLWVDVLRQISEFVGGPSSALFSTDVARQVQRFNYIWGNDPEYSRLYMEKYVRLNPMVASLMMMQVGEVWSVTRVMPMKQFHETLFYKEWVRPQGQGDIVGSLIERAGTVVTTLATPILERDSPASEQAKSRLGMLLPHVRRAVAIGDVIEMNRVEADSLGDAVDAMSAAVFLVGRESEVMRSNTSGRALIEDCPCP